jgi:ABC-type branched-subunit amino acid transport system permease subunit
LEFFLVSLLNGVSYGLLLFMLSSGLTLIFSMMGVLNFAHASFYMLGAYFGYQISKASDSGRRSSSRRSRRRHRRAGRALRVAPRPSLRPRARAAVHVRLAT